MKKFIQLLVTSFMLAQAACAFAADKKTTAKPVVIATSKVQHNAFSIDLLDNNKLDSHYSGTPLPALMDEIERLISIKRGEFESSENFAARQAVLLSQRIFNQSINDTFAVVRPVRRTDTYSFGLGYQFNRDTGNVSIFFAPYTSSLNGIGGPDDHPASQGMRRTGLIDLEVTTELAKTYEGSNAYGATVTVQKKILSSNGLSANIVAFPVSNRKNNYDEHSATGSFSLENGKAAEELPSLKALIVLKIREPYLQYHFTHSKPTYSSPTESSMQRRFLNCDIIGIVVFSGLSGDILLRLPQSFGIRGINADSTEGSPKPTNAVKN